MCQLYLNKAGGGEKKQKGKKKRLSLNFKVGWPCGLP